MSVCNPASMHILDGERMAKASKILSAIDPNGCYTSDPLQVGEAHYLHLCCPHQAEIVVKAQHIPVACHNNHHLQERTASMKCAPLVPSQGI